MTLRNLLNGRNCRQRCLAWQIVDSGHSIEVIDSSSASPQQLHAVKSYVQQADDVVSTRIEKEKVAVVSSATGLAKFGGSEDW